MDQGPARRQFVKVGAAAIATARFPILGANDRINMGVVGLGGRGNNHITFYGNLDSESRIAGLCDVNQAARERAVARVKKVKGYDPERLCRHAKDVRIERHRRCSIATPNHWHALAAIWAMHFAVVAFFADNQVVRKRPPDSAYNFLLRAQIAAVTMLVRGPVFSEY